MKLLCENCNILKALQGKDYVTRSTITWEFRPNQMQIMLKMWMIRDQFQDSILLLGETQLLEEKEAWWLGQVVKLNAITHTTYEITWIRNLMIYLGFQYGTPMVMYCENQSTIFIVNNSVFHKMIKHIEVDCHCIRDVILTALLYKLQIFLSKDFTYRGFLYYVTCQA